MKQAQTKVRQAAKDHGKLMWWNASSAETVREMTELGIQMFLLDSDVVLLDNAFRSLLQSIARQKG